MRMETPEKIIKISTLIFELSGLEIGWERLGDNQNDDSGGGSRDNENTDLMIFSDKKNIFSDSY